MFDRALRERFSPLLEQGAAVLDRGSVRPGMVTLAGLVLGLGAAVAAGFDRWWIALVLWLTSRLADGLDGALARRTRASGQGGYWDIMADFTVYGAFVVGVAVARPDARLAAVVLLCTYYVSGASFLAWSAATAATAATAGHNPRSPGEEDPCGEKPCGADGDGSAGADGSVGADGGAGGDLQLDDNRSVRFVGGLAEGFETIVAYAIVCLVPDGAALVFWVFAAMVAVTALQRVSFASRHLSRLDPAS